MLCLAEFIFSLLEWIVLFILDFNVQQSTLRTANQSCGQTLPTILVFLIYCSLLLFPSSSLEPNCLEYRNSFPAFLTSVDASSASEWIDIWACSLARQRCCTFSKHLNSFASLANIFQLCSCPLDSASTNSENDENPWSGSPGRPIQKKLHHLCFAIIPGKIKWCLASAQGKSLPQDQNWVGRRDKQLCLTLNLYFWSFPKWNFLNIEQRKQIYLLPFVNIRSTKLE